MIAVFLMAATKLTPTLTMPSFSLAMVRKMDTSTGSFATHGLLLGVRLVTSAFTEVTMRKPTAAATLLHGMDLLARDKLTHKPFAVLAVFSSTLLTQLTLLPLQLLPTSSFTE